MITEPPGTQAGRTSRTAVTTVGKVHDDHGHVSVEAYAAYLLDHVGDVGPAGNGQAEEPGELGRDHLRRGRGRHCDVDDRDVIAAAGVATAVEDLDGLAELGDGGGLPGAGGAGDD